MNPDEIREMVTACMDIYGGLDAAYNNAGIDGGALGTSLVDTKLEIWNQVLAVNLTAMFICMKYEIELMLKRGGGAIVNVGAIASKRPSGHVGVSYVTSKHGMVGLTLNGAVEYATQNIRVNAVLPGIIRTPLAEENLLVNEAMRERARSLHAMGRIGEPKEVSDLVLWLCSDEASFITGAIIPVDGGFLLK
jgi:NAD(P)-dependent dehydrogenase (short-subunit alcohol dehydrogenase family)